MSKAFFKSRNAAPTTPPLSERVFYIFYKNLFAISCALKHFGI